MSSISFNNLITASQIQVSDIDCLIKQSLLFKQNPRSSIGQSLILASLFFESSTRTRFSFEAAMLRLGGQYISLEHGVSSSITKGESLEDMGQVMSAYADIIVMRHPKKGSVEAFTKNCKLPVINGGDGSNEHPTQALIDIMTIYEKQKKLDNLTIGFWGDLKNARTINSLIQLLALYPQKQFIFIALPEFQLSESLERLLIAKNQTILKSQTLADVVPLLDVLYVTRTQTERLDNPIKDHLQSITKESLATINDHCSILHPLPRVNELAVDVDTLPNAAYFDQAENGLFMRMALLKLMLAI